MVTPNLNKDIVKQPMLFFLGAGSSVPLGMPTTLSFQKALLSKSSKEEKRLIKSLYASAAYRYRISEVNLEDFIEYLHELRLGLWILSHSNPSKEVSRELARIPLDSWADADLKVNRTIWKVLEVLHETCGDCSTQKVSGLWGPIFEELKSETTGFPIFTLNYDWAFEKFCIGNDSQFRLTDGFSSELGGEWSSENFSKFASSQSLIDIYLFKLHGSTCWVGDIKSLGSFENAAGKPEYGFESAEGHPFEIVYPGYRREVWLGKENWSMPGLDTDLTVHWRQREPYSTLYQYLEACLANAKIVIVIGYAFADRAINSLFAESFKQNKDIHFLVVDPGTRWERQLPEGLKEVWYEAPYSWASEFKYDLDVEAWNNRLHWIRAKWGTKSSSKKVLTEVKKLLSSDHSK